MITETAGGRTRQDGWLRLVPGAAVLVLAASVVLLAVTVTSRPARLEAAEPADRAQLAAPPAAVTLTFSGRLDPREVHVSVYDSAGRAVGAAAEAVAGATVRRPVSVRGAGGYRVNYHVAFGDGRSVTGTLGFTVAGGPGDAAVAPAAGGEPAADGGHGHAADPLTIVVIGLDVVALALGAAVVIARRRRRAF